MFAASSLLPLAKSTSCISQNLPCSCAAIEAIAAGLAARWNWSGKCLKTSRTSSGYLSMTCCNSGCARAQNGHSKSEYSTIVTRASGLPLMGAPPTAIV